MLFDKTVLHAYSEFLDQQGLVVPDSGGPRPDAVPRKAPGEDDRSHEQLVEDFLSSQREPWDEGVMPPGWYPEKTSREIALEAEMVQWREKCQREERERVDAQRLVADRAHYVPREDFDAAMVRYNTLDEAYARCRADHLTEEQRADKLDRSLTMLKDRYNKDTERLRQHLAKAYEILAGAYPPLPDADLGRVLYEVVVGPEHLEAGDWQALAEDTRQGWRDTAERLRAQWSTVETSPMPYAKLAEEWGAAQGELLKIEDMLARYVPGLERRIGPDEWMGTSGAVRAVFEMVRDGVQASISILRAGWPVLAAAATIVGYHVQPPTAHRIGEYEAPEPTLPAQNDLSAVLAERLRATEQATSEGAVTPDGSDPAWQRLLHAGRAGGETGEDAIIDAYSLGLERGVERGVESVNGCQSDAEAARKMAGEILRLGKGLEAEGITLRPGPIWGAEVDTALRAIQGWGNAHLGLATTQWLFDELIARGRRLGWREEFLAYLNHVVAHLPEDDLTYKTVDGRAASAKDASQRS